MAKFELIMPKMGESIAEATIIRWLKEEGDKIEVDEAVLEIATDKVDSEVPSPQAGILSKKLFAEGDVVAVGAVIAEISAEGEEDGGTASTPSSEPTVKAEKIVQNAVEQVQPAMQLTNNGSRFYSPLVLNIAKTEGISMEVLESIPGTGKDGRVTKKDILAFVNSGEPSQMTAPSASSIPAASAENKSAPVASSAIQIKKPEVASMPGDEIMEMDRMRKLIAEHMVMSKHTAPHVTSFVEADVTNLVLWRDKMKNEFLKREGEKLTFTPLFIEAIVRAIKDFPMINISVDGDRIIKRKAINVGMAAALPSGNLIVPVIKNADTKNLIGITREVNDLANRARNNKLSPDEISGGTYTLTNVGTFGNVMGTPIINQPQVAIMATGAIRKKPAVIETPQGDMIGIRHFMFLSHSYDHRVVDGALGGMFVRRVADYLENWDLNREI